MGLFDVFSGSAGRNAAIWQANLQQANEQTGENQIWNNLRQGLGIYGNAYGTSQADLQNGTQQGRDDLARAYSLATDATNSGYDAAKAASAAGYGSASNYLSGGLANALASLYGGTGAAQGFLQGGAGQASGDISGGLGASLAALNQGYGGQQAVLGGLGSTFNPWSSPGASAQTMLANAQGLNGPQGNAAALSAFQASPGYQYQVQQALDQVNRAAAASGMANSGNTLTALQNRASDLANQGWQQWLAGLQGTGQTGLAATGQQAGIGSQLGSSLANQGLSTANVATGANQNLANIAQGTGNLMGNLAQQAGSQAGNWQNQGGQLQAQNAANAGNTLANQNIGQGNLLTNLASQFGTQNANLDTSLGSQLSNLAQLYGNQQAGAWNNATGQALSLQNATTNAQGQAGQQGLMAGQQADATLMNFLLGAGGLGLRGAGLSNGQGGTLGGSLASGLGSLGSGLGSGISSILGAI